MKQHDKNVLIVVTSHSKLGETNKKTGFYYEELAVPYWKFIEAGYEVDIISIRGGSAPVDPASVDPAIKSEAVIRFLRDPDSSRKIQNTKSILLMNTTKKTSTDKYSMIYLPGGHGTMWDFPESKALAKIIGHAYDEGVIIGAVCHGVAGLNLALRADGNPVVTGHKLTSFSNAEEEEVGLTDIMPFLLETRLRSLGAEYESAENFHEHVVVDGNLITGQNPASSGLLAEMMIKADTPRAMLPPKTHTNA